MNARNGKIARLPHEIREELNQRLEQSQPGPRLLAWLNARPEVKQLLRQDFDGVPISLQNLCQWRQGGFEEWLARQELWAGVNDMEEFTSDLEPDRDNVLADDVATVLAARFAGLLANWNGEADGKFEAKARVLNGLCRSVVQLQRSMHQAKKDNAAYIAGLEAESEKLREKFKQMKLNQVWAIQQEPVVAKLFGGGELGQKLAGYFVALQNDMPNAKLDLTMEDLERMKGTRKKSRPVKQAGSDKAGPETQDNPLQEKELENGQEGKPGPGPSKSVKAGQGSLPATAETGFGTDERQNDR